MLVATKDDLRLFELQLKQFILKVELIAAAIILIAPILFNALGVGA